MSRFAVCLFAVILGGSAFAASYDLDVPPEPTEKYKSAAFRIWIPDGVKTIRAVIIRQHGCGRDGIHHSDDLQWQALAKKHDAALLGSKLTYSGSCGEWCFPKNGSERALLEALKTFAKASEHPELEAAPWAIWGHSGGSIWACELASKFPERVVAVWGRSGAITDFKPAALAVPIVFNYGVKESEKGSQFYEVSVSSLKAFETHRPQGALWALAVDPKSSHDCRESRTLAIAFFDAMLKERLPKTGVTLLPIQEDDSRWLAGPKSLELRSVKSSKGGMKQCHWLPNESYGKLWLEYCRTGSVKDTTVPPTPTDALAKPGDNGVTLTWKAECDLESGVKGFAVLRDGKRVAVVGSPKGKSNPEGHFQIYDYGDEPIPQNPPMSWNDAEGKIGSKYEVIQLNFADLESKPSAATVVAK